MLWVTVEEPLSQDTLYHLRWMLQKDKLGQDMFLIGRPGSHKAHLAMQYLELTGRELEYVALSRDTTESDLKQRREITHGTAVYIDQVGYKCKCILQIGRYKFPLHKNPLYIDTNANDICISVNKLIL